MLVGVGATQHVEVLDVLGHRIRKPVEELVFVHRPAGAAFTGGAVVGRVEHDGVFKLPGFLQVIDDAANLHVRVLGERGVDLGQAREQRLLFGAERIPGPHVVSLVGRFFRQRVERCHLRAFRQHAFRDHALEHPRPVRFVSIVELALVLGDVVFRRVVRGVVRARVVPHEPRPRRVAGLLVADHRDGLVREVLRQVIALLGSVRRVDKAVVLDKVGIPLIGFATEETVEAVEPLLQRPLLPARARRHVLFGDVVVLAEPERAPARILQELADGRGLLGEPSARAGKTVRRLGDRGHAVHVMIASRQHRRSRWRAERGGMPLRIRQAVSGELVERRHVDPAAVRRPGREAGVVVQDEEEIRRPVRGLLRRVRPPVRFGVADVELDLALEAIL